MSKSLEQVFHEFNIYFLKEFGVDDAVTKIGLEPRAFDAVMSKLYSDNPYGGRYTLDFKTVGNGAIIAGIRIVPRRKDDF